jgi:hypothetical protein
MRNSPLAVVTILILATLSCQQSGNALPIAPDNSLSVTEYISLCMPAPDRPWAGIDYERATEVLRDLASKDPTQLPRFESGTSSKVFGRIVALDNLGIAESAGDNPGQRLSYLYTQLLAHLAEIIKLYTFESNKGQAFDAELAELMSFFVAATLQAWIYADDFIPSISQDDPRYDVRMDGVLKMKEALATTIAGCLTTLAEKNVYRIEVLVRFAGSLSIHLPFLVNHLTPESRQEVLVRLRELISAETDTDLKQELEKLLTAIESQESDA